MTTVQHAMFTVSWTSTFPSVLAEQTGRLATRSGYANVFADRGRLLGMPWDSALDRPSWSRFWSSYLGSPRALRKLGTDPSWEHDSAWEHVIPFQMWHQPALLGPVDAVARSRVLLYPAAISVTIAVNATGSWRVDELADGIAALYSGRHWGAPGSAETTRTLQGIATDLRDDAATFLAGTGDPAPEARPDVVHTVAAPVAGVGSADSLSLNDPHVQACVAGLASLGPPGEFDSVKLLGVNSNANRGARAYVLKDGHALWHPARILHPGDALVCLVRNHTDLAVQIEALAGIVDWSADWISQGKAVPLAIQPLIRVILNRLRVLHLGNGKRTYRSEIARLRIDPLLPAVEAVERAI
ncbi:hypothetical protein ACIOD2_49485 [Amycolatopsis sp. NPDC088138]|uniref:hypothetical protein n=1 Tax=Amycolatopsis sp. NPDC088138 TaxID=3363938 RepID=UPI00380F1B36